MIDTFKEKVLSIDEADRHIAKISGKKRNRSKIIRWANRGVAGVKLRTILIGSEIFTSREALNEFLNLSREAKQSAKSLTTAVGIRQIKLESLAAKELGI